MTKRLMGFGGPSTKGKGLVMACGKMEWTVSNLPLRDHGSHEDK